MEKIVAKTDYIEINLLVANIVEIVTLKSSNFSAGGDWSVELTYRLINDTSPRFVLMKYQEDTLRDGEVKFDRVYKFGD